MTPEHYKKHCPKCSLVLDPYRIGVIYALNPMADHIVKKGLCAGNRGHKELRTDLEDIIKTARRWLEMLDEDAALGAIDPKMPLPAPGFEIGQRYRVKNFSCSFSGLTGVLADVRTFKPATHGLRLTDSGFSGVVWFDPNELEPEQNEAEKAQESK